MSDLAKSLYRSCVEEVINQGKYDLIPEIFSERRLTAEKISVVEGVLVVPGAPPTSTVRTQTCRACGSPEPPVWRSSASDFGT